MTWIKGDKTDSKRLEEVRRDYKDVIEKVKSVIEGATKGVDVETADILAEELVRITYEYIGKRIQEEAEAVDAVG